MKKKVDVEKQVVAFTKYSQKIIIQGNKVAHQHSIFAFSTILIKAFFRAS